MDLASLAPVTDGVPVPLRHPVTGEKLTHDKTGEPITISIVGMDSDQFRARHRAIINRRLNAGKKAKVTAEEIETESIGTIAACVTGWAGVNLDGADLTFTIDNVKALLARLPFIREQLDEAIADRANFLKGSQTN